MVDGAHLSCLEPTFAACFIRRSCLCSNLLCLHLLQHSRRLSPNGGVARVKRGEKLVHEVVIDGVAVVDAVVVGCRRRGEGLFDLVLFGTHVWSGRWRWQTGMICRAPLPVPTPKSSRVSPPPAIRERFPHVCSNSHYSSPAAAISNPYASATASVPDTPSDTWASGGPAYTAA